jgi:Dullard-like phosphatase family protein
MYFTLLPPLLHPILLFYIYLIMKAAWQELAQAKTALPKDDSMAGDETPKPIQVADIITQVSTDPISASPRALFPFRWFSAMCSCFRPTEIEVPNDECDNKQITLLPSQALELSGRKTLVLDLDETLVHSSFQKPGRYDLVVPVEIDGRIHHVYVAKRPGVDEFLMKVNEDYELIIFTASLAKYADPLLDKLDPYSLLRLRLFRESCTYHNGSYVKDLSRLGRDMKDVIIIDNSPMSYLFQPQNAVPIKSWFDDMEDRELLELLPALEYLAKVDDVTTKLGKLKKRFTIEAKQLCDFLGVARANVEDYENRETLSPKANDPLVKVDLRSDLNSPLNKKISSFEFEAKDEDEDGEQDA